MININDKFKHLFEQPKGIRYYIVTGGRGGTKSFSISTWANLKTFEQHAKILYTRYTLRSAEKSIIPEFEEKIELLNAKDHFKVNKTDITNERTGSSILFSGIKASSGNQTANLKSLQGVSVWVVDEAEELVDEQEFDKIDLSIRTTNSNNIIILILNPATKEHWIYKRFFEEMGIEGGYNGTKGDVCYIHTSYLDNIKNLSETFLNRIEHIKLNKPKKYEHEILGGWKEKAEGVIFTDWEYGTFDDTLTYYYGLDFGYASDPDACVKVAIDEKRGILYLEEVFYNYAYSIDQVVEEVKKLPKGNIVADSAEKRLIDHLAMKAARTIIPVKKGAGTILQGIRLVQNYKIVVCGESINLAKELNNYTWNGKAKEAPIDDYNHCFTGETLVYTLHGQKKINKIIPGEYVYTQFGSNVVEKVFNNGTKETYLYRIQLGIFSVYLRCTENHKIKTDLGWIPISQLKVNHKIYLHKSLMERYTTCIKTKGIFLKALKDCIGLFGNTIKGKSQKDTMFIMLMEIHTIIQLTILTLLVPLYMLSLKGKRGLKIIQNIRNYFTKGELKQQKNGINQKKGGSGILRMLKKLIGIDPSWIKFVLYAGQNIKQDIQEGQNIAIKIAKLKHYVKEERRVYDLQVQDNHEYYANGVLVHNCIDSLRYVVFTYSKREFDKIDPIENKYTNFVRGDDTGAGAAPWNVEQSKGSGGISV